MNTESERRLALHVTLNVIILMVCGGLLAWIIIGAIGDSCLARDIQVEEF